MKPEQNKKTSIDRCSFLLTSFDEFMMALRTFNFNLSMTFRNANGLGTIRTTIESIVFLLFASLFEMMERMFHLMNEI